MAKKQPKKHRVYCTYFPDGRYYIGYSCKTDKQFEKYFGSSVAGARLIRFVAEGCKQKTVLAQADRVPIASGAYEGGYVDITSDAGLDLVSKCNEINLNSAEEQSVIDRIGQDEYTNWKSKGVLPLHFRNSHLRIAFETIWVVEKRILQISIFQYVYAHECDVYILSMVQQKPTE